MLITNNQETRNKQYPITNIQDPNPKKYDLEPRTTEFAKSVIRLCQALPRNIINAKIVGQLVASAGSIGANYREANDALGKKDFVLRLKIARKETKETIHWLALLQVANSGLLVQEFEELNNEAIELKNILSSIIMKIQ